MRTTTKGELTAVWVLGDEGPKSATVRIGENGKAYATAGAKVYADGEWFREEVVAWRTWLDALVARGRSAFAELEEVHRLRGPADKRLEELTAQGGAPT